LYNREQDQRKKTFIKKKEFKINVPKTQGHVPLYIRRAKQEEDQ